MDEFSYCDTVLNMCNSLVFHLCFVLDCLRKKSQIWLIQNRHFRWNITYETAVDIRPGEQNFLI